VIIKALDISFLILNSRHFAQFHIEIIILKYDLTFSTLSM